MPKDLTEILVALGIVGGAGGSLVALFRYFRPSAETSATRESAFVATLLERVDTLEERLDATVRELGDVREQHARELGEIRAAHGAEMAVRIRVERERDQLRTEVEGLRTEVTSLRGEVRALRQQAQTGGST